jgi:hypothetical protein
MGSDIDLRHDDNYKKNQWQGRCLTDCVVYEATVKETVSGKEETYTGMTGNTFKDRWNGHKSDTRNHSDNAKTKLSAHRLGSKGQWNRT